MTDNGFNVCPYRGRCQQCPSLTFGKTKALGMNLVPWRMKTLFEQHVVPCFIRSNWNLGKHPLLRSSCYHLALGTCTISGPLFTKSFNSSEPLFGSFADPGIWQVSGWVSRRIFIGSAGSAGEALCWCFLDIFVGLCNGAEWVFPNPYTNKIFFRE